jgi:hypothetical protein
MIEVGAGHARRPVVLHAKPPARLQFLATPGALRVTADDEHDDVPGFRSRPGWVVWFHGTHPLLTLEPYQTRWRGQKPTIFIAAGHRFFPEENSWNAGI